MGGCDTIKNVIVYKRTGGTVQWNGARDKWLHDVVADQGATCEPEWVSAEHPLFLLYTSGSTGKPKGVQHSTGGYLLHAALTTKWTFDLKPDDVFWCTADIGWVTGHTYITYGPLACGGTEIVFEGVPTYPDAGRFWKMIESHKVTVFYTAPTAIRSLIKAAESNAATHPRNYKLDSLRLLGSVGEPINPAAWEWYHQHVGGGRCPIVDTWWQTETGGHMISPLPYATPTKPGSATLPVPGIFADIVDETGQSVGRGKGGILVIRRPWPGMLRTIWGDPERYKKTYWPEDFKGKLYLAGDGASTDEDGYFRIVGRIDGDRIGARRAQGAGCRGGGGRPARRPHRRGGGRLRGAERRAPHRRGSQEDGRRAAQLGGEGNRPDREAEGHPFWRQPAEDALGQDHAPPAALDRQGRGNHAGRLDAGEPRNPGAA
jgi:acetyl-CoA synthetase